MSTRCHRHGRGGGKIGPSIYDLVERAYALAGKGEKVNLVKFNLLNGDKEHLIET